MEFKINYFFISVMTFLIIHRFIFETHKLAGASPATVSRLGVVHLGSTTLSSLIQPSKLEGLPSVANGIATAHLSNFVGAVGKLIRDRTSSAGLIEAALIHLKKAHTQNLATYGLLVSLCGQLNESDSSDEIARMIYQGNDSW